MENCAPNQFGGVREEMEGVRKGAGWLTRLIMGVVLLSAGCYSNYAGNYDLRSANAGSEPPIAAIANELRTLLADLGFAPERDVFPLRAFGEELYVLVKKGGRPPTETGLQGERARVDVVVRGNSVLVVGLKDYDNSEETQFITNLKKLIETCLREKFGFRETMFRRAWDELSESDSIEAATPLVVIARELRATLSLTNRHSEQRAP